MTILEDLINKCNRSSLANRGGAGGYVSTAAVIQKNGKSLADNPRLNVESLKLYKGNKTFKLIVLNIPDDSTVTYESSDATIASVNAKGVITQKKAGEVVVTATYVDEEEKEWILECSVVCSTNVAMVGETEYANINDAVEMSKKRSMPVVPLDSSVIYYAQDVNDRVQVRTVYSGAKMYVRPPTFTEEHSYEVQTRQIDSNTVEYFVVDIGSPEVEFTNSKTGEVSYINLSTAFQTAGTYKILKDIPEMSHTIYCNLGVSGGDIVVDLDGHTMVATKNTKKTNAGFSIAILDVIRANVTVEGRGGVLKLADDSVDLYGIHRKMNFNLVLNDVTVIGQTHAVYSESGFITINGGYYEAYPQTYLPEKDPYGYTLNCLDSAYASGEAKITVNGGTFFKFNPADNIAEGEHTNFVAEGKTVTYNEEAQTYTVA